jgi:3-phenylpropionate/cinnamic acid dioxygenase small subunit
MTEGHESLLPQLALQFEVERFFTNEAELLDERRFEEWLELFAEDARYYMPIARNLAFNDPEPEYTRERADASWFDEGKPDLCKRVLQIQSGDHWAEEPRSRTTHVVSNVHVTESRDQELTIRSRFVVSQNRQEHGLNLFVGKRIDVLRRTNRLQVVHRTVLLDQSVLLAQNLTTFF